MNSVFAYFFTTDKAITTKLDQNIKQVKFTQIYKFEGQKGRGLDHVTYFYILHISGTGKTRDFKFGAQIDRQACKPKMQR